MNNIKRMIGAIVFIFCNSLCEAQQVQATPAQWAEVEKKMIESRAYIFEGSVIQQFTNWKASLTCCVVKITKIYKGNPQIKLGTIKVITEAEYPNAQDGDIGLGKGAIYVIFGNPTNSSVFDSIVADNSIILTANNSIIFLSDNSAQWGTNFYRPLDSLYSVFKRYGLTVQEQIDTTK